MKATSYTYPAVFTKEADGGYSIRFPQLDGCFSQGETLEEALTGAEEALSLYCTVLVEDKKSLPAASNAREIAVPTDGILSLVNGKLSPRTRSVKKTLTIPGWLNDLAMQHGIPFSETLQEALIAKLGLRP